MIATKKISQRMSNRQIRKMTHDELRNLRRLFMDEFDKSKESFKTPDGNYPAVAYATLSMVEKEVLAVFDKYA